jgi:MFS family permease
MRRGIASLWHASSLVLAGVLFFLFVLPRWFELTGQWPGTLGTALRIVCGVLVGLTALPVVLTLARTRKPELGTPALALSLRVWSIVGHVAAGVLITGAAISEIWLDLDTAGQWLFGIYGAAAAIALLAAFAFYLAFVAELPPPPPKPLKVKSEQQSRRGRGADASSTTDETVAEPAEDTSEDNSEATEDPDSDESDSAESADTADEPESTEDAEPVQENAADEGKLRNRRPSGKSRRGRTRGGIATED